MKKLRINPLVFHDLKEIRDFIAEDNTEKAVETIEKSL
jgi:plasmid stabilization system protein ParE